MSRKIEIPNLVNFVRRYEAGESVKALASELGISRIVFRRNLLAAGVDPRNRSQGMFARMARTAPNERRQLAAAANIGRRNVSPVRELEISCLQAQTKERTLAKAAPLEFDFMAWMIELGFACTPQKAVGPYNLDIAVHQPPIAVEIAFSSNPFSSRPRHHRERTEYLLNAGWHVCYILVNRMHPLRIQAAQNIITWAQLLSCNETNRRQYRVIRGDGEFVSSLSNQF